MRRRGEGHHEDDGKCEASSAHRRLHDRVDLNEKARPSPPRPSASAPPHEPGTRPTEHNTVGEHSSYAWEKAGRIWYETIRQTPLTKNAQFTDFARATIAKAHILFGKNGAEGEAVTEAWRRVGVVVPSAGKGRARKT
ncbi:MAG: M4 family metallopeptidase [Candidatus Rokuibacteriota bacterium]